MWSVSSANDHNLLKKSDNTHNIKMLIVGAVVYWTNHLASKSNNIALGTDYVVSVFSLSVHESLLEDMFGSLDDNMLNHWTLNEIWLSNPIH